ncbi:MAG: hypothetical protein OEX81_02065 [Candidatus Pacebacteria bacterium]|nr:hypothetical protein [Candidatus Paceibacterota bacterium]
MKNKQSSVPFILSSVIIAVGIFMSTYLFTKDTQFISKSEAVQGCYVVAQGKKVTTGVTEDEGEWSVEEAVVSQLVIDSCLSKKGY